jgi:hypothetical protein
VYRFGEAGYRRPEPDPNFHKANPSTLYVPAGQLALAAGLEVTCITKADIQARGYSVMQVQLKDREVPSVTALASSILYPAAEDHRMIASPEAWWKQFVAAFKPGESPGNKERLIRETTERFAGAIMLQPRRRSSDA